MSPPSVARLPPFREVRSFAPPPRGGFALSLVAAEHNSTHSGVCLHTRRLEWCKLRYNTLLSLRAEGGALSPSQPFDSPAISSELDRRTISFAPHGGFVFIATPERQRLYVRLYIIVLTWRRVAYRPHGHFSQCLVAGKPRGKQESAAQNLSRCPQPNDGANISNAVQHTVIWYDKSIVGWAPVPGEYRIGVRGAWYSHCIHIARRVDSDARAADLPV
jgi:hypothetical protein